MTQQKRKRLMYRHNPNKRPIRRGCVEARVIADSMSSDTNIRITTLHLRYPRIIHSELMTHRVFSRNARSSRAVPTSRLLAEDMFIPEMMANAPGMQSRASLEEQDLLAAKNIWEDLACTTIRHVEELRDRNVHKQWANRPLEWFGYIDVLVTSTEWENFFELRLHKDAQPEIYQLAEAIEIAMDLSVPWALSPDQWHMPYVTEQELDKHSIDTCLALSVARCARISYAPFDGNSSIAAELERFRKLIVAHPMHASPAEHQASPDSKVFSLFHWLDDGEWHKWRHEKEHANFNGWRQLRHRLAFLRPLVEMLDHMSEVA